MTTLTVCEGEADVNTTEVGVGPEQTVAQSLPLPTDTEMDAVIDVSDVVRVQE